MYACLRKKKFGIPRYEIMAVLLFYIFFAYFYHITLFFNRYDGSESLTVLLNPYRMLKMVGLHYLVKLVFSLFVWWLIFKKFKTISLQNRILIHLLVLPVWVLITQQVFYSISDALDWGHLMGKGQVWDIYIPALFYVLQFGLLHTYEYYRTNQRHLKKQAALSEAALKSELSALKAQLNPHFLYNVFNTISASVPPEQEATRELIAKLSDLFRYQLKATKTELIPLQEELEFVEKYLDLEKARFEDRLKIIIDVPQNIRMEKVPPMILQPLVENSLRHGLSSLIEGGEICIRIKKVADKIQFEVSDTGIGVADKSKLFNAGIGLTNTKLRLKKMYDSEMKISDNTPQGLKIEFSI